MNEPSPVEQLMMALNPLIDAMDRAKYVRDRYPEYPDVQVEADGRYWQAQLDIEATIREWVGTQPPREVKDEGQSEVH